MTDQGGLLPAEQKVLDALGHLPLDFRAMAAVSNLLRDVGQGRPFGAAFASRIRRSLAEFQNELNSAH